MYAQDDSIICWRGTTVPHCHPLDFWCYLIHFEQPIGNPNEPKGMAGHYLGVTSNLSARLLLHKHKNGSRLMEVVSERSVSWEVAGLWRADTWEESRDLEHALKRRHNSPQLCPLCNPRLQPDVYTALRQGHWPLALHDRQGRRQPTGEPQFTRR